MVNVKSDFMVILSFVMSNCEVVTFPLVSSVRCGAWLYQYLIFTPFVYFYDQSIHNDCEKISLKTFTLAQLVGCQTCCREVVGFESYTGSTV